MFLKNQTYLSSSTTTTMTATSTTAPAITGPTITPRDIVESSGSTPLPSVAGPAKDLSLSR